MLTTRSAELLHDTEVLRAIMLRLIEAPDDQSDSVDFIERFSRDIERTNPDRFLAALASILDHETSLSRILAAATFLATKSMFPAVSCEDWTNQATRILADAVAKPGQDALVACNYLAYFGLDLPECYAGPARTLRSFGGLSRIALGSDGGYFLRSVWEWFSLAEIVDGHGSHRASGSCRLL